MLSWRSSSLSGEWKLTTTSLGVPNTERLLLTMSGGQITGSLYRDGEKIAVKGTMNANNLQLEFKVGNQQNVYAGRVKDGTLAGTYTIVGKDEKFSGEWNASRAATDRPASPRTLDFDPKEFHRVLSSDVPPVLRIWPGDTVRTSSVDAGGQDEKSVHRVMGGNPLTGPFYVEGAMPGDVVAITIMHLRINRDWAMSDSILVERALTTDYALNNKPEWKATRWHLDSEKQTATLENASSLSLSKTSLHHCIPCWGVSGWLRALVRLRSPHKIQAI